MLDAHLNDEKELEHKFKDRSLVKIDIRGYELLEKENITLEILRKIQDKKFEVDLEYERTRDLFEKQRVVDQYLEEHFEDNMVLNGYYQNTYHQAKLNRFVKHVYSNTNDLLKIRTHFYKTTATTVAATAALGLAHPYLCLLMAYDYYLLGRFTFSILNNTLQSMTLEEDKMHVLLNRSNFLGFLTQAETRVSIGKIRYLGYYQNTFLNFDQNPWLPPSIANYLAASEKEDQKELQPNPETGEFDPKSITSENKDKFRHFVSFMAKQTTFLVPLDNSHFEKQIITEDLL